nr:dihydrodipicolinate synthase family protein [Candidatus Sigynarchaeota archaeon]
MKPHVKGLVAAAFSPLKDDGSLNIGIVPKYAAYLASKGVVGVFVNGSSGEGFSFTTEERMKIAEAWVKAAAATKLKVIIHCSHHSIVEEKQMAAHAQKIGAFGIGTMGPLYFKPKSAERLAEYCRQTAAAAPDLPYYFYNIPRMSGINVSMLDFIKLASETIPNFAGIKYSDPGDFPGLAWCKNFDGGRFNILHGQDESLLPALSLGITAAIGSTYNLGAPIYTRIIDAFEKKDLDTAREYQLLSINVVMVLFGTGEFFSACKATMKWLGIDLGPVRSPLKDIDAKTSADLKKKLEALGFFKICA